MQVLFALVPPPEYSSGAPCFCASIISIGVVTYFVGEVATLFGCALGVPDAVTAISFVALGTSLPDTFASRQAAQDSSDADAAIGNVTGVHTGAFAAALSLHAEIVHASSGRHQPACLEIVTALQSCRMSWAHT